MMERLLTVKQMAQYLQLKPVTIRRKAANGEIPSVRVGGQFRFDKDAIDRWLLQKMTGKPVNVLVIDDELVIGQLFYDSLKEQGCHVTIASSGIEALELIAKRQFDLIFLDLIMPEIDGIEIFRRIRMKDKYVPVAIITGYPDSDLMKKAMEQGPFLIMNKPIDTKDILATVRSISQGVTMRQ